jgi:NitT/TauT family transport system permease protein
VKNLLSIFSPNKTLSKSTGLLLVAMQAIALLGFWCFSSFVFLPNPSETLHSFGELWKDGLGTELITSFYLNLQAIGLALLVSLFLAYASVVPFFRPLVSFLSKLRFLSLAGLTFFFTMAASSGHELKLYLLVYSISVFFVTSMADVLNSIPKVQFDLARTLKMGEWRIVWEVIILGQADKVFDVLRQNAAIGWMMLTMIEGMSRSEGGIGAVLLNQNKHFHLSSVMAIQLLILAVGLGQDYAIGVLKNIFCPYASLTTERK